MHPAWAAFAAYGLVAALAAYAGWLLRSRRGAVRQLEQEASRHAAVIDSLSDAVISIDAAQRIVMFNPAAERLLGCSAADALGRDVSRFVPSEVRSAHRGWVADFLRQGAQHRMLGRNRTLYAQRADGSRVAVEVNLSQLGEDGGGCAGSRAVASVVLRDITEREAATHELLRSREDLRRLTAGQTSAREQERRHLARELHDELGQRLSAIKMALSSTLADADDSARRGELAASLRELMGQVDATVASVRRIAADLRPAMLDDLGLEAALEWLADDWAKRSKLQIALDLHAGEADLGDDLKTAVYRIVQEALTNIARHSGASRAWISLHRHGEELRLRVADNGVGLAAGDVDKHHSFGLMGIRERARLLGGSAAIANAAEGGCALDVRLPLPEATAPMARPLPDSAVAAAARSARQGLTSRLPA